MTRTYLQVNRTYLIVKLLVTRPSIWLPLFRYLRSVVIHFFLPQFQTALKLSRRPVVNVDHPLDSLVPFRPEYLGVYLSFINLWVDPLLHLYEVHGKKFIPSFVEFLKELDRLYREAGEIYRTVQSTSRRPGGKIGLRFTLVRMVDPHLHCVPSLHVVIIIMSLHSIKKFCGELGGTPQRRSFNDAHYNHGIRIMESILLVKQHSVNCIAAGMFLSVASIPGITSREVKKIVRDMFPAKNGCVKNPHKIHVYINSLFDEFLSRYNKGTDVKTVLVEFLKNYSN